MPASRFVPGDTTVLTLADGNTLTVRTRLNHGETQAAYSRMYFAGVTPLKTNPLQATMAIVTAYLVDWTLVDNSGAKVEIRRLPIPELESILNHLDDEAFDDIHDAIATHEQTVSEARAQEKKLSAGGRASDATSPSPDAAAGGTNGS